MTVAKASVTERYVEATPRSRALYERATKALPGGNTRTTLFVQPYPFYFDHGVGCRIYDVDGNEYIDFINNYTSLILGHTHPAVVTAVQREFVRGMSAAAPCELEVTLAEALKQRLPSVDLLRFTNSGTEATMLAIRAARAFTGRTMIAKCIGSYHGSHDYAAVDGINTPDPRMGVPEAVAKTVVAFPFNDPDAAEQLIEAHKADLAAVIVEPVMGSGGVIPASPAFLQRLRDVSTRHSIVLIFDEIIAFRIGYHGAQGYYGIQPDLTTLGKIIGSGLPVGAVGGREEIMARFDPRRRDALGHGGTFNANPLTMAAGLATLNELTPEVYTQLETLARDLQAKLLALFGSLGVPAQVNQIGSLFNIHFADAPVTDYASATQGNKQMLAELYLAALNAGVALTGRGMGCISTAMSTPDIDACVAAIHQGMEQII